VARSSVGEGRSIGAPLEEPRSQPARSRMSCQADGPVERKDGGRWRWSTMGGERERERERENGGQSGAVDSAAAAWSCWSMPWRCGCEGAVNGEEWIMAHDKTWLEASG
jgi:hypothetical protein